MSVNFIYFEKGAKMLRPITSEAEYRALRDNPMHRQNLAMARQGKEGHKKLLHQFNYSLAATNASHGFPLKGANTPGNSVGMDIDHIEKADLPALIEKILAKKEELGLLMLERSCRMEGLHVVFKRHAELSNEENLKWAAQLLGVEYDKGAKDLTRVFFATSNSPEDLIYLDPNIFLNTNLTNNCVAAKEIPNTASTQMNKKDSCDSRDLCSKEKNLEYCGVPYSSIIKKWWEMYNDGQEPVKSNRNTLTFELAVNLRHICGFDRALMDQVIPCYDGFSESEKLSCIDSALSEKRTQMPKRLKDVLQALKKPESAAQTEEGDAGLEEITPRGGLEGVRLPQGVKDSIDAVGPALAMPMITAICPAIGMLATGVKVEIHSKMSGLNLIAYIAGDFASGKGSIDPVIKEWTAEVKAMDKLYEQREEEWRAKKRAAKNKKEQPEEQKFPVRCLTLNNTVANLAERLANTVGKHAFSFTPEADTVAQKWKSAMSDFSVMLRQAYDGTPYEREARSADAVNVHIDRLLWNVVMCGTPDALYRVVNNYTDGFQSRIAVARTPDNTFSPLDENLHVLTDKQAERIRQVAHLLPLMEGEVRLAKLEEKGREWLETIRLETMKNDDRTRARQRFRICPTTMRMMTCLMLCRVAESLITKHGLQGAETRLKQNPSLWKELIVKMQTPQMLAIFDTLADYQLENALYFFRDRIEAAFASKDYASGTHQGRVKRGKNDSIFARLGPTFNFEQAMQQSIALKGTSVTREAVRQMLKNWEKQGLVSLVPDGHYTKTNAL